MRKQTICMCKNNGADQLCSNCEDEQHICFRNKDRTILLFSKSLAICACTVRFLSDLVGKYIFSFLMTRLIVFQSIITYNLALFDALGFETLAKNPGIRIPPSRETRRDAIIEQLKKPKNTADILCLQEVHVRSYIYQDVFVLKYINVYMCLYDQTFSTNRISINMHRFLEPLRFHIFYLSCYRRQFIKDH